MVYYKELLARVKQFYRFSRQEVSGLAVLIIATAFIFSFRDWGKEQFDLLLGLRHLSAAFFVAAISILFRVSCQKIYGLAEGYKAEFKMWWAGIGIALIITFISLGHLPLVLAGSMSIAFMVKQRLGEFRYGFSKWHNGIVAYWGILGNLIMAGLFAIGALAFPESYFFGKGLIFNIIMAFTSLLPLPQLDGLAIFFASRKFYVVAWIITAFFSMLLLTGTKLGLILAIIVGLAYALIYILIGSEK